MLRLGDRHPETGLYYNYRNQHGNIRWISAEQFLKNKRDREAYNVGWRARNRKGGIKGRKKGSTHTPEARAKISEALLRRHNINFNPAWVSKNYSRIARAVRGMTEYPAWRKAVFDKDGYKCMKCGHVGYITAHHIKSVSKIVKEHDICSLESARACAELWDVSNGQALCEKCHSMTDNYKGRGKKL